MGMRERQNRGHGNTEEQGTQRSREHRGMWWDMGGREVTAGRVVWQREQWNTEARNRMTQGTDMEDSGKRP